MKSFNIKNLPYFAAVFQAVQFAHAGSVYFGNVGWVIGAIGGALVNLAVVTAASRISDIAKSRRGLSYVLFVGLLIISPAAIAPAAFISAVAVEWLWARLMVAIVWASMPDLSIALTGSIAGKSLVKDGNETQVSTKDEKLTRKPKKVSRKPVKNDELLSYFQGNPGATDTQVAEYFGITRQAIGQRRKILYPAIPPKGTQS